MIDEKHLETRDIAVLGMAVMGKNLALNMADNGFKVSIYNRSTDRAQDAADENPEHDLLVCESLEDVVRSLKKPRRLFLMVKAGDPVDLLIDSLIPLLDTGDIIMDGGNSYYQDSEARSELLHEHKLYFLGVGVSGGESGARFGPSLMPGGDYEAYEHMKPIFDAIAAKAEDGKPCSSYMGEGGAGHYVKMVHNGIEYADMEIIVEIYHYLQAQSMTNEAIAEIFQNWNEGQLSSYLSEITVKILLEKDVSNPDDYLLSSDEPEELAHAVREYGVQENSPYILDHILDISRQKGTGRWTNEEGLALGVDLSVLASGLNARYISMHKSLRVLAAETLEVYPVEEKSFSISIEEIKQAFLAARVMAYTQGFALYRAAAKAYQWNLNYGAIAATFREGCIIRSALLNPIMRAYDENPELENLLLADEFQEIMAHALPSLRKFTAVGVSSGYPLPAFSASVSYYDQIRCGRSSANLIQGLRDFFGAHTFQRTDRHGIFHHDWPLEEEV